MKSEKERKGRKGEDPGDTGGHIVARTEWAEYGNSRVMLSFLLKQVDG